MVYTVKVSFETAIFFGVLITLAFEVLLVILAAIIFTIKERDKNG